MSSEPIKLQLTDELNQFVQQQAVIHGHANPGAYLESLVLTARSQADRDRTEQLVLEGAASGEPVLADDAFWSRFKRELNSRIKLPKTA